MLTDKKQTRKTRWMKGCLWSKHRSVPLYSFKYRKNVCLKNGTVLFIRPIRGADARDLGRFFEMLSEDSIFCRFGLRGVYMSQERLTWLCQVDYDRDFAFLAVVPGEKEHIVGEVRLNRLAMEDKAELSFIIADQWQGKGVGNLLMEFCLGVAKEIGLTTVLMVIMKSNIRMIQFGYKYNFQLLPGNNEDDTKTLELKIRQEPGWSHPIGHYAYTQHQNSRLLRGSRGRRQVYH